jgi:hypothetical protein
MSHKLDKITQLILSVAVVLGFFTVVAYKLSLGLDTQLEIGALIGAFGTAIAFQFGSNAGSQRKTELLAQAPAVPPADAAPKP